MELIKQNLSSLDLTSIDFIEIFITPEIFAQLGYGRFDGKDVQEPAKAIASMSMFQEFFLAGYGVTSLEAEQIGARIYLMREKCRHLPDKRKLREYRITFEWVKNQLQLKDI